MSCSVCSKTLQKPLRPSTCCFWHSKACQSQHIGASMCHKLKPTMAWTSTFLCLQHAAMFTRWISHCSAVTTHSAVLPDSTAGNETVRIAAAVQTLTNASCTGTCGRHIMSLQDGRYWTHRSGTSAMRLLCKATSSIWQFAHPETVHAHTSSAPRHSSLLAIGTIEAAQTLQSPSALRPAGKPTCHVSRMSSSGA